jgi:hypothetical protein
VEIGINQATSSALEDFESAFQEVLMSFSTDGIIVRRTTASDLTKGKTSVKATNRKIIHNGRHSVVDRGEEIWRRGTQPSFYAAIFLLKIHKSTIMARVYRKRERERESERDFHSCKIRAVNSFHIET